MARMRKRVARFREGRTPDLVIAARRAARWMADNITFIRHCDPKIPEEIFNRAADNWAPLLAIAEVAGEVVSARAIQAALEACNIEEEQGQGTLLLADIRNVFSDREGKDKDLNPGEIRSKDLVSALIAMPERPWDECNRGKAMTQNLLAKRLKPFGIWPKKVGPEHKRVSGYALECFADSFIRYIPSRANGQPDKSHQINNLDANQNGQTKNGCPVANGHNSLTLHGLSGCPDEKAILADGGEFTNGDGEDKAPPKWTGRIE